jgi:hypothetical protein
MYCHIERSQTMSVETLRFTFIILHLIFSNQSSSFATQALATFALTQGSAECWVKKCRGESKLLRVIRYENNLASVPTLRAVKEEKSGFSSAMQSIDGRFFDWWRIVFTLYINF